MLTCDPHLDGTQAIGPLPEIGGGPSGNREYTHTPAEFVPIREKAPHRPRRERVSRSNGERAFEAEGLQWG